jgi:alkanesulfonate monooxygenase SsuD/methylene tetrahydromethanopterin reductase-like flavin-dependent oxidoreductase (luciferase family)
VLLRRVARLGDGWFPQGKPDEQMRQNLDRLRGYIQEAGRDPDSVGIEARINASDGGPDEWARLTEGWRQLGATHISINTMNAGFQSPSEHMQAIRRYKEAVTG